jgi:hypothetical protein
MPPFMLPTRWCPQCGSRGLSLYPSLEQMGIMLHVGNWTTFDRIGGLSCVFPNDLPVEAVAPNSILTHQIVDLPQEFFPTVRFGDEATVIGNFSERRPFSARRDHQKDMWPPRMNLASQFQSIDRARHLNISE